MRQNIIDEYTQITSTNLLYQRYEDHWQFLLNSYMGGQEYKDAGYLTRYVNETPSEYEARLASTHLENHAKSVISTYISFLFREHPERELGTLETDPTVEQFLEDADLDGRSFNNFMKEVSIWNSVFGHCFIMLVKPNVGAVTRGQELEQGVRPYLTLLTPLTVFDWSWHRKPNGAFELTYLKYAEEVNDTQMTVREWTKETIKTWMVDHKEATAYLEMEEVNGLGEIPVVISYNNRSPVRGIGISDISDIAYAQKSIYNMTSEVEQSVRINGHPALVMTPDVEASAGAGAVIQIPENLDSGLKPYMLDVSTDTNSIFTAIQHTTEAIDKMANTGSIRATESRRMSGVAQEQEFQLLNAKLSEKADNMELTEEQIWQWYAQYQGREWTGKIEYPGSFNIRDTQAEIEQLVKAKSAATDPRVIKYIDKEILKWLEVDDDVLETMEEEQMEYQDQPFEPHMMYGPNGEEVEATTLQQHLDLAAQGYTHEQ